MRVTQRKRFNGVATDGMICNACHRRIRTGQPCVAIVQWSELLVKPETGEEWDNDLHDGFEVQVTFLTNRTLGPEIVVKVSEAGWKLKTPPTFTTHHKGCGFEDRPLRRLPGSFEAGKRR